MKAHKIIAVLVGCFLLSCTERIINNRDDAGENVYSLIWGLPGNPMSVIVYNTKAETATDTIFLSPSYYNGASRIAITPDERILIFSAKRNDSPGLTQFYDLLRCKVIKEYQWGGDIALSPDGKIVAIGYSDLHILNLRTWSMIYADTTDSWACTFDRTGSMLWASQPGGYLFRYDIPQKAVLPRLQVQDGSTPWIDQIVPTNDTNKLFLHLQIGSNQSYVISYFIVNDSIGASFRTHGAGGDVELTPDGEILIYTDPVSMLGNEGTRSIYLVDANTDQLLTTIPPSDQATGNDSLWSNPERIAITPDGSIAAFCSGDYWTQPVISIADRTYIDFFRENGSDEDHAYAIDIVIPR